MHIYGRGWSCDFQKCNVTTRNSFFHLGTFIDYYKQRKKECERINLCREIRVKARYHEANLQLSANGRNNSWPTIGPFIRGKIRRVLNFPYKRHISSKIRRDLAKTRLILEQPLTPVLR